MFSEYDTCYSDYFDYPYYHSYTMDAYQNLISGDKGSVVAQGNCSGWLLTWYNYYTQKRAKIKMLWNDNGKRNKANPVSLFNTLCIDIRFFLWIKTNAIYVHIAFRSVQRNFNPTSTIVDFQLRKGWKFHHILCK